MLARCQALSVAKWVPLRSVCPRGFYVSQVSMVAADRTMLISLELGHCYGAKQNTSVGVSSSCNSPSPGDPGLSLANWISLREARGVSCTCQGAGLGLQVHALWRVPPSPFHAELKCSAWLPSPLFSEALQCLIHSFLHDLYSHWMPSMCQAPCQA